MGKSPEEIEAENAKAALRNIRNDVARVFIAWDPLALRGLSGWQKHYDPFIGPVAVMVKKRVPAGDIADYLMRTMTGEWGLPADLAKCREMSEKFRRVGSFLDAGA